MEKEMWTIGSIIKIDRIDNTDNDRDHTTIRILEHLSAIFPSQFTRTMSLYPAREVSREMNSSSVCSPARMQG